jgi:hypothetical protein
MKRKSAIQRRWFFLIVFAQRASALPLQRTVASTLLLAFVRAALAAALELLNRAKLLLMKKLHDQNRHVSAKLMGPP